jgi:hypothetical protein
MKSMSESAIRRRAMRLGYYLQKSRVKAPVYWRGTYRLCSFHFADDHLNPLNGYGLSLEQISDILDGIKEKQEAANER